MQLNRMEVKKKNVRIEFFIMFIDYVIHNIQ